MLRVKTFVLYHAHCADGFGAAWAAFLRLRDSAEYVPVEHGVPPPELPPNASVYILDFCYPRDVIRAMHERFAALLVIDHHQTAEEELRGLPYAHFDNEKSGAVLAWEHFHPNEPVPELLRYIMDRDLWTNALPNSHEVFAALSSYPMDFGVWSELADKVGRLATEGVPIVRYQAELVRSLSEKARFDELAGFEIPVVNTPLFSSELGAELLARYPDAPFVAIYFDRADGKRQWSLRSREDFDVSRVARRFQNGGHRQAAGFESDLPKDFMPLAKSEPASQAADDDGRE
jgi:hypothetical protein